MAGLAIKESLVTFNCTSTRKNNELLEKKFGQEPNFPKLLLD